MTNATKAKSVKRIQAKTTPKPAPKPAAKLSYHALILADFKACQNAGKAGVNEYGAFKAVLLAVNLNDAKDLHAAQADIKKTFGEAMKDSAAIRCTMINNARKVQFGGVVDKVVIKGNGRAALVKAVESVSSIRELRKALSGAKPAAMTDNRGGDRAPKASGKPAAGQTKISPEVSIPVARDKAIEAAVQVLQFVADRFLVHSANKAVSTSAYATIGLLKGYIKSDDYEADGEEQQVA